MKHTHNQKDPSHASLKSNAIWPLTGDVSLRAGVHTVDQKNKSSLWGLSREASTSLCMAIDLFSCLCLARSPVVPLPPFFWGGVPSSNLSTGEPSWCTANNFVLSPKAKGEGGGVLLQNTFQDC